MKEREVPSLGRSIIGLTVVVGLIAGGYVALRRAGESAAPTAEPGAVLRYTRSGGLMGETVRLVVRADGRSTATLDRGTQNNRRTFTVSDEALTDLDEVFAEVGWPKVSQTLGNPNAVADGYRYDVTYRGVTVTSYDPMEGRVRPVVLHIERRLFPERFAAFD